MEIEKLKQKILDLAIRGKLVPQNPNDEPASVLIEKIKAEREKLVKEGKIKKAKDESFMYKGSDNSYYENKKSIEVPFDIPSSWVWQKLKTICDIKGGKRIPKGMTFQKERTDHIYIRVSDMKNESISEENLVYINNDIFEIIKNYIISKDDLYVSVAGTIGKCGKVPNIFDGMNLTENADKLTNILINKEWLLLVLTSKYAADKMYSSAHQVAQPKLSIDTLGEILIPIPPKEEMIRIVELVNSAKKHLSNIGVNFNSLKELIEETKRKILDMFFETDNSYKSYYENDYKIGDILEYVQPGPYIVNNTNYDDSYNTPVLTPGKTFILGYTNEKNGIYHANQKDKVIIFDDFTTATRLVNFDFKVKSSAMKILKNTNPSKFDIEYMFYLLQTIKINNDSHKRFWISEYAPKIVKIHTLNDQKNIVALIHKTFKLLDSIQ